MNKAGNRVLAITLAAVLSFAASAVWGTPFVNLDFEQASVPPGTLPRDAISTSVAFPGWTAGPGNVSTIRYENRVLDEATVVLVDTQGESYGQYPVPQGGFYARLYSYFDTPTINATSSIEQSGDVPAGTHSIQLLTDFTAPPLVFVNGSPIPLQKLGYSSSPYFQVLGGDISQFQEQTVDLELNSGLSGFPVVDAITFSPQVVPEPGSGFVMIAASAALVMSRARRR